MCKMHITEIFIRGEGGGGGRVSVQPNKWHLNFNIL